MTYRAPVNDMLLALHHGAGLQAAVKAGHYGDFDGDITAAVLEEAGKFASDVLAPLNRVGDEHGIKLEAGKVTTAPGWPDAYQRWAAAGWNAVSGPEAFGGQGLPLAINAACTEIWSASNIAFGLIPPLERRVKSKKDRNLAIAERALQDLHDWLENTSKRFSNTSA